MTTWIAHFITWITTRIVYFNDIKHFGCNQAMNGKWNETIHFKYENWAHIHLYLFIIFQFFKSERFDNYIVLRIWIYVEYNTLIMHIMDQVKVQMKTSSSWSTTNKKQELTVKFV